MDELAANNPCIKFILDNYVMLCRVHPGKTVMVIDDDNRVAKTFDSMVDAMTYTRSIDMTDIPYAMIDCNGADPVTNILFSTACKTQN